MKTDFLSGTAMTAIERSQGRYLRGPGEDGHDSGGGNGGGQGNQGGDQNNSGNSGDSKAGDENNNGQSAIPEGFWSDPKPKEGADADSSASDDGKGGDQGGQSEWAKGLVTRLDGLKFDDVFTDKIADEIGEGNLAGANERFAQLAKESIRQSVIMSAEVMKQVAANVMAEVDRRIGEKLGGRDDDAALKEAFTSYNDPEIRPILKQVYAQSLKHTGGDRTKAIEMTRDMMKLVGKKGGKDLGFEAPPGKDDVFMGDAAASLVEDLLTRDG